MSEHPAGLQLEIIAEMNRAIVQIIDTSVTKRIWDGEVFDACKAARDRAVRQLILL